MESDILLELQTRYPNTEYTTFLPNPDKTVDSRVFQLSNAKFSISPIPRSQCGSDGNGENSSNNSDVLDEDQDEVEAECDDDDDDDDEVDEEEEQEEDELISTDTNRPTPDLTERSETSPLSPITPRNPVPTRDSEEVLPITLNPTPPIALQTRPSSRDPSSSPELPLRTRRTILGAKRPYTCPNAGAGCKRSFSTKSLLGIHVKNRHCVPRTTRLRNRPDYSPYGFPCSFCETSLTRKYNLRKHMQKQHGLTERQAREKVLCIFAIAPEPSSNTPRVTRSRTVRTGENSSWARPQSGGSKRIKLEQIEAAEIEASLSEAAHEGSQNVQDDDIQWPEKTGDLNAAFFKRVCFF